MKTVIEMAREAGIEFTHDPTASPPKAFVECWAEELERFVELVRADERNSWPAEMEAMERQVNILTDELAKASKDAARYQVMRTWDLGGYDHGLYSPEEIDKAVDGCIEDHT